MIYFSFEGMPKQMKNAKIALLDFSLQKAKMKMGVQVLVTDPEKLEGIRQRYVTLVYLLFSDIMTFFIFAVRMT